MKAGRPISLILSLALAFSAAGQVALYAVEDVPQEPDTTSEGTPPSGDSTVLPEDPEHESPAPEETPGEVPEAVNSDEEAPDDELAPPDDRDAELAPAWAGSDPDQDALARSMDKYSGENPAALTHSYELEGTLTIPAGKVVTLASKAGTLCLISRAPGADADPLIKVEAGATLILKDIVLDGGAADVPDADNGVLIAVSGILRLESGATLCDNGLSSAVSVAARGEVAMAGGEIINCGFSTGFAVRIEAGGAFAMTGGSIWYDAHDAEGRSLYGNAILNGGQLEIDGKSAIFSNGGVVNSGTFSLSGGTLTGTAAQDSAAPPVTGVTNSNGGTFQQTGGTVQFFALGVENSGAYTLSGGSVTGNGTGGSRSKGGGIHNTGSLTVTGGTVKGNNAGLGGEIYTTENITLSGKPVIGASKVTSGIYLAKNAGGAFPIITVTSTLAKGSVIAIEDSEHPNRHVIRRNVAGEAANFTAAELGCILCCSSSRQLKYDDGQQIYYLAGGTLQDTIDNAAKGSAASPVVIYLAHNTPVDRTVEIAGGTTARNIKLVGGSLVRGEGSFAGVMLHVPAGSTLVLDGVEIDGSLAAGGATGALVHNAGTLTVANGSLLHSNVLASPAGSAAGVENNATFKMTGGAISGNTGTGVVNRRPAGSTVTPAFTLSGGEISGNRGNGAGGGVASLADTTLTMSGGAVSGNTALLTSDPDSLYGSGGGIYSAGTFKMTGGTISGNHADDYGGGVYADKSKLTLTGGTIENNTTGGSGGGVYGYGATIAMSGGTVSGNGAYQGGGLFLEGYGIIKDEDPTAPIGQFTLSGGTISGNTAEIKGGGVMNADSILIISGGTISGNTAGESGGGIYNLRDPEYHPNSEYRKKLSTRTFEMKGGTISGNTASAGGGVFNEGVFALSKGTVSGNKACFGGGIYGLHNPNFQITVSGGSISGNSAVDEPLSTWSGYISEDSEPDGSGGGILSHGPLTISGATISGNTAAALGGGVLSRGYLRLTGGTIKSNTAQTGWDVFAGAVASGSHVAGFELRGKPVVGSKTEAGGLWLDAPTGNTEHVCINVTGTLSTGCFVRFEGSGGVERFDANHANTLPGPEKEAYWERHLVVLVKDSGNLTAAEQKMFFCGPLERGLSVTAYSGRKLQMTKASGTLQARIDAATGGTAKKPVVLTLTQDYTLEKTLAIGKAGSGNARHITLTGPGTVLSRGAGSGGDMDGTMVTVAEGSTLALADITLDGTRPGGAADLTGPIIENAGTLTLKAGALLRGNHSSGSGGAISNTGTLLMQGGAVTGNTTTANGGGIFSTGHFEMTGGDISDNSAQNGGGAAGGGTFVLQGGAITGNHATASGGGLWLNATSTFTLSGARIGAEGAGNIAGLSGGGLYSAGAVALKGGEVAHNGAVTGGGLYQNGGSLTLIGGDISHNTAVGDGGGLYQTGGSLFAGGTARLLGNTAGQNGGGLYVAGSDFKFRSGAVIGNTADENGGGLYLSGADSQPATLGGTFEGNGALKGGGAYATGVGGTLPLTLSGTVFAEKNTAQDGAGLYLADTAATLHSVQMTGGEATQNGGGLYLESGSAALYSGSISGNSAEDSGGGIYALGGELFVYGGEIAENRALYGGGIYSGAAAATAIHSGHILRNGGADALLGGGMLVDGKGTLRGGTIQGNTVSSYAAKNAKGADLALTDYSAFAARGTPMVGGHGGGIAATEAAPLLLDAPLLAGAALVMETATTGRAVAMGSDGYLPNFTDTLFLSAADGSVGFDVSTETHNSIITTPIREQTRPYVYYNREDGIFVASDKLSSGDTYTILATPTGHDAKTGYSASFWTDGTRHYKEGDIITVTETLVLVPVWTPRTYTVEYYREMAGGIEAYPTGAQQTPGDPAANPTRYAYGKAGTLTQPLLLPEETTFTSWALYNPSNMADPTGPALADLSRLAGSDADYSAWIDHDNGVISLLALTEANPGAPGSAVPTIPGEAALTLRPGDAHRLAAESGGAGVFWFSSDTSVATVGQDGLVTAKKSGHAYICAAIPGGSGHAEVVISVRSAQPLAFQTASGAAQTLTLLQGGTANIPDLLLFDGEALTHSDFSFYSAESANKASAPVDESGLLTAEKACTTTLTVMVKDDSISPAQTVSAALTVRILPVTAALTALTVSPTEKELLPGKSQKLTYSAGKAQLQSLTWEIASEKPQSGSPGEAVVTLDTAKNTVMAANPGTAVLRCTATDLLGTSRTAAITIRVAQRAASVTIFQRGAADTQPSYNLHFNDTSTLELEARLAPANTSNTAVVWKSSNTNVALVDASTGVVTAGTKTGTATITATAADGSKKKHSVKVSVGVPVSAINLQDGGHNVTLDLGNTHTIKVKDLYGVGENAPTNTALLYEAVGGGGAVTVSGKGIVKAVGLPLNGQPVTIRVVPAMPLHTGVFAEVVVTVKAPLTALKVDQKAFTLQSGRNAQLSATQNGGGPVDSSELRWTSANPGVLAVNSRTGRLAAMPVSANTKVSVTVTDAVSGLSAKNQPPDALAVGKTWKPVLTFTPSDTTNKNVVWEIISGAEYVQLNANSGTVKALSVDADTPENTWVELRATPSGGGADPVTVKIQVVQPVTALKMSQTKATLQTGNSLPLSVAASPTGVSNPAVTWKSSNAKVATVNENGLVTAHKGGSATITATAVDGSQKKATAKITVRQRVEDVSFVKTGGDFSKSLNAGQSFTLKGYFNTAGQGTPTNRALTWASSDPSMATVSAKGVVKTLAPTAAGQPVTITATSADNPAAVASCTLTITPLAVTKVAITQGNLTVADGYDVGDGITLTAALTPAPSLLDAAGVILTWTSSAPAVATVSADPEDPTRALLHPVSAGTITITATAASGKSGSVTVTVSDGAKSVTGIFLNLNSTLLKVGNSATLKATAAPADASLRSVEWQIVESYDANGLPAEGIAAVSAAGKVTAKAQGTVVVQARSWDGGHTATCTVSCVVNP